MSDPWLKFYPTDWRSDPALRMCSLASRGLWIEMIALMHEAVPYGHLLVAGRSPTDAQIAVLAGAPSDQIPELLGELEAAGVFSRTKDGVIYSRKMTRTAKKAAIARKNGKNGGNPALCNKRENLPSDNQKPTNRVKPQKPEARNQNIPEANASGRAASESADPKKEFWEKAKAFLSKNGIPQSQSGSFIGKCLKQHGLDRTREAFKAAQSERPAEPIPWITACLTKAENQPAITPNVIRLLQAKVAEDLALEAQRKATR